jgi:TRAP-type uncharacterized transport system substrate-binding protein
MKNFSLRRALSAGPTPFVALAVVVLSAVLCLRYVVTAPPHRLVIAADSDDGYFTRTARRYAARFAAQGVTLEIITTHGATDNLERINAPGSKVDVAFAHGGLTDAKRSPTLESLGSIAYEPLWVVYRAGLGELDGIPKLRGRTIGIGRRGSGTEAIARRVLTASGVTTENSHIVLNDGDARSEASAVIAGALDAMFVMGPLEDERIRGLFADERLRVMSLSDAEGLARNLPFLHALTIPKSTVDLALQKPDRDLSVVASTITLVARKDVHPAIIYLLMSIVDEVHEPPSLLHKENEFPSDKDTDLPLSPQAETYYRSGKPFLQRYLPFGLASAVERLFKVAVPIGLVVLPFVRALPAFYQWRVKRKLARSYRELLEVERGVSAPGAVLTLDEYEQRLSAIEQRIREANIPLLYSNELYVLREHIELARRQIASVLQARGRGALERA